MFNLTKEIMMDITKSREAFEKWAGGEFNDLSRGIYTGSNECVYLDSEVECCWKAWKASRENIEVGIDWPEANDDFWKDGENGYYAAGHTDLQKLTPYKHRPDTYIYYHNGLYESKDYCNNVSDAWPIIAENRINIEWHEWKDGTFKPYALSNETMVGYYDESALRAAMIVFLMMKDQECAK